MERSGKDRVFIYKGMGARNVPSKIIHDVSPIPVKVLLRKLKRYTGKVNTTIRVSYTSTITLRSKSFVLCTVHSGRHRTTISTATRAVRIVTARQRRLKNNSSGMQNKFMVSALTITPERFTTETRNLLK